MVAVMVVVVGLVGAAMGLLPPPSPAHPALFSSPDTSLCAATDSLALCEMKTAACSGVWQVLSPPAGLTHTALTCANTTSLPLTPSLLLTLGAAANQGRPDTFLNSAATQAAFRQCVLNATGLLEPDKLALDRGSVAQRVKVLLPDSPAVAAAVVTCPEPVGFNTEAFLKCLRVSCMSTVAESPLVAMAQSVLQSPVHPAASNTSPKPRPAALTPAAL